MKKSLAKTQTPNSVLIDFIEKEDSQTVPGKIKQVQGISTLTELVYDAYKYTGKEQEMIDIYNKRVEEIADQLLLQESDICTLIPLYLYNYGHWQRSAPLLYQKVWDRIELVLSMLTDIDELIIIREKLHKLFYPKDRYYVISTFETHMVKVASICKKRKSFSFLMSIREVMSGGLSGREELAVLMPQALLCEKDISTLQKYYDETFSSWNHHDNGASRAVQARIQQRLSFLIPRTKELETLDWYRRISNNENKQKVDKKLRQIAQINLNSMNTLKQIMTYQKEFQYISWKEDKYLREVFETRVNKILPAVLNKIKHAESAYDNLILLSGLFFNTAFKSICKKFLELVPAYFEKNPSIEKVVLWDQFFERDESWNRIVECVATKQKDLNLLAVIITENKVKRITSLAKEQLKKLVLKLTKPNQFFLDCVKNEKFFDNKEIFIEKAKKFAS